MTRRILLLLMCAVLAPALRAQTRPAGPEAELYLRTSALYDSNLDHEPNARAAYGALLAAGLMVRDRAVRPHFELGYEIAAHGYSESSRLERVSHHADLAMILRPARALALSTGAEISFRGSSEDRDVGNEFEGSERLELRMSRTLALRATGAYRLRWYPDPQDAGRDATNRYAELELQQRFPGGARLTLGGRLERNVADLPQFSYARTTLALGFETAPDRRTQLELEVRHRDQRYTDRLVAVGNREELRHDLRLQPEVAFTVRPWRSLDVVLGYSYERRRSNDPDKAYDAHVLSLALTRWL